MESRAWSSTGWRLIEEGSSLVPGRPGSWQGKGERVMGRGARQRKGKGKAPVSSLAHSLAVGIPSNTSDSSSQDSQTQQQEAGQWSDKHEQLVNMISELLRSDCGLILREHDDA